jgi:transposase
MQTLVERGCLANAQYVKKVPGRKSDVKDAEWLAELLCHGLLRSSFVPRSPSANCVT